MKLLILVPRRRTSVTLTTLTDRQAPVFSLFTLSNYLPPHKHFFPLSLSSAHCYNYIYHDASEDSFFFKPFQTGLFFFSCLVSLFIVLTPFCPLHFLSFAFFHLLWSCIKFASVKHIYIHVLFNTHKCDVK
jgi:hypothetical protein